MVRKTFKPTRGARRQLPKVAPEMRRRLHTASGPGAGWMAFTMEGEGDVSEALKWLGKAYEKALTRATRRAV